MEYELRNLTSADIYPVTKIITKIGFKEFKNAFDVDTMQKAMSKGKGVEGLGVSIAIDIAGIILSNLANCEDEINKFLSSVSGLDTEKLKKISMADYAQLIIDIVKKEEFADFFKVVSKLLE